MDYKRLTLAAVVAWVVDAAYGFVVWGMVLKADMEQYPGVFRSEADMAPMMPIMFAGSLLGMFALAWIYAKGYEGGSGIAEGLRFGAAIGVLMIGFVSIGLYAATNTGRLLAVKGATATFIEMVIVGAVIGALYRPAAAGRAPSAV